jgi:tetratricopeptide (TPR) repeat protein
MKGYQFVEQTLYTPPDRTSFYNSKLHQELSNGDWESLYETTLEWLQAEPDQPIATFLQNIACLFINPPAIIRNKKYLDSVGNQDWKAVLNWFKDFYSLQDLHNPYFQAINFILQPSNKKVKSIETALMENPNNGELLFLQSISLRDKNAAIEKLKLAVENKPEFPAALYLLGIFSLELNQVDAAEDHLKQAISQSPDFLEAHYQLGSLYSLYIPDSAQLATAHFEKVIELDPEGGAGRDARKVLENKSLPQYGQRVGGSPTSRRGGMSTLTILGISLFAVWLFTFPVSALFKFDNPLTVGITAGLFVFIGIYLATRRRNPG